jgi:hypothetical protein
MFTTGVGHGMTLLGASPSGAVYVVRQVAHGAWAILEISAADLLRVYESETMPTLNYAKCVAMGPTKRACLQLFQKQEQAAGVPQAEVDDSEEVLSDGKTDSPTAAAHATD